MSRKKSLSLILFQKPGKKQKVKVVRKRKIKFKGLTNVEIGKVLRQRKAITFQKIIDSPMASPSEKMRARMILESL